MAYDKDDSDTNLKNTKKKKNLEKIKIHKNVLKDIAILKHSPCFMEIVFFRRA